MEQDILQGKPKEEATLEKEKGGKNTFPPLPSRKSCWAFAPFATINYQNKLRFLDKLLNTVNQTYSKKRWSDRAALTSSKISTL